MTRSLPPKIGIAGDRDDHTCRFQNAAPPTKVRITTIGNDVRFGHAATIRAGVTIGDGAVVASDAVVARNVPPDAVDTTIRR